MPEPVDTTGGLPGAQLTTDEAVESVRGLGVDPSAFFFAKKGRMVGLPPAAGPVADAHTHLGSLRHLHPAVALARASVAGVRFLVDVVDPTECGTGADDVAALRARWLDGCARILDDWSAGGVVDAMGEPPQVPEVRLIAGCHPHNAKDFDDGARALLGELLALPMCSGVGEIGLDYHYDLSPRDVQVRVFAEQLDLARELGAPLSLHVREAHPEAAGVMRAHGLPGAGVVLHCFDLGPDDARPFLDMGCYLGLGGALTFKRSDPTRAAALSCGPARIVNETDAPYMSPEPLRGTYCEPAMTALTASFTADLFHDVDGTDRAATYAVLDRNARSVFGRAPLVG